MVWVEVIEAVLQQKHPVYVGTLTLADCALPMLGMGRAAVADSVEVKGLVSRRWVFGRAR